jgi:hypothetical protein
MKLIMFLIVNFKEIKKKKSGKKSISIKKEEKGKDKGRVGRKNNSFFHIIAFSTKVKVSWKPIPYKQTH